MFTRLCLTGLPVVFLLTTTGDNATRFRLPPGFTIECIAAPPLVEHPMMGCFDDGGRLFIAESAGQNLKKDDLLKSLPNFIRVLEPDASGKFTKSRVFADKLTFPMGVLWHGNSLYAASSGGLWRFWDTTGKGVADKRQEIVTKFGYTGNAADIHGPFLGPDGRLYWCDGRHGHEIDRPDGTTMRGKAARIFRSRPDGSEVEVICGGGMDNPVEIAFTELCEPLVTVNILHNKPRNDAIIYAIEGGNYPWHDVSKEFPRTGDLLPAVGDLGWVAPSGLMRYRSGAFGKGFEGNLFSAQFNRSRIQRHIVERDGAAFKIRHEDFLTSDDKNFHPTDVLEDADGSLIVIDTGGWFRIGCPTSKIAQPEFKGAIYRIRKQGMPKVADPAGREIAWDKLSAAEVVQLLDDPRFVVRERAVEASAKPQAMAALQSLLLKSTSTRACINAIWTLARIDTPEARGLVRRMLTDKEWSVRVAAAHVCGLVRDEKARAGLVALLGKDQHPAVRREAALSLSRLGKMPVEPLMESLRTGGDRFLEHALLFSAIQVGDRDALAGYLKDTSPIVRRGALIALDQMKDGNLTREEVTPLLNTSDAALLKATLTVIAERPGWGKELTALLKEWLAEPALDPSRQESLRGIIVGLGRDSAIQVLAANALKNSKISTETRLLVLESMSGASFANAVPDSWIDALTIPLHDPDVKLVGQAVNTVRALDIKELDPTLLRLAEDTKRPIELRLAALAAAAPRMEWLEGKFFDFLVQQVASADSPLPRLSAATTLGQSRLREDQIKRLVGLVEKVSSLELPPLLAAFEAKPVAADALIVALEKSPGLSALTPTALKRLFPDPSPAQQPGLERLLKRVQGDPAKERERLAELEPLLRDGNAERGRQIFLGMKASCSVCHVAQGSGGKIGPDLSKIGAVRSGRDLLEAVVFPSASFARGYEPYVVETRDGKVHGGILGRETADALYLVTAERAEIRVPRSAIDAIIPGRVSIMPQGLDTQLSPNELRDLLAYLQELR